MAKQNQTYNICKIYKNGHQWTDKIVGKDGMRRYTKKLLDVIVSDKGKLQAYTVTASGRMEDDIARKDEINYRAFANINNNDYFEGNRSKEEGETETKTETEEEEERDDSLVLP